MRHDHDTTRPSLAGWVRDRAIPFSFEPGGGLDSAVDRVVDACTDPVEVLGLGEGLHGDREILTFRNRLFRRLVESHGYTAIALESSYPRGRVLDGWIDGRSPAPFEDVRDDGFSHGFGRLEANRELAEWMRTYNGEQHRSTRLRFYGFDAPTEMTHADSPRGLLGVSLSYLGGIDGVSGSARRERIDALLGPDTEWENPGAMMDPSLSIGRSPNAVALRAETEDLISELMVRRPELAAVTGEERFLEAVQFARAGRQLLAYHAAVAQTGGSERTARLLGMRDAMMADNLAYIAARERSRGGRVLVHAHNSHLRLGQAEWVLAGTRLAWWTAGAHLDLVLGRRYAVIGTAVGVSVGAGISRPEPGTLEALLVAAPGPARFVPTRRGRDLPDPGTGGLRPRSGSTGNPTYFPLTPKSPAEYDWLVAFDETAPDPGLGEVH
ncbi:MAG: erythromycin esterase family protein [Methanospirillum sp.]|nr:erythromycin esterase family protein [Methanospirillum sp.]